VPSRPAPGAPIDAAWGGVAHDAAVAQDIQIGTVRIEVSGSSGASVRVTFPRPFAAVPVVLVSQGANSHNWVASSGAHDATGFTAHASTKSGAAASAEIPVAWVAIGPRA
jgi:hypothetical protein